MDCIPSVVSTPDCALDEAGEPVFVIVPQPRPGAARIVGPGRREIAYLARVSGLEARLQEVEATRASQSRALEAAALVDRGNSRRMDRLEGALGREREVVRALEQREKRWVLALGALQRENELLRERLAIGGGIQRPQIAGGRTGGARSRRAPSLWSTWIDRLRRRHA